MALQTAITCKKCKQQKGVWYSPTNGPPDTCDDCKQAETDAKKQAHLDALAALPMEERIRKLEEFMYEHPKGHPRSPVRY